MVQLAIVGGRQAEQGTADAAVESHDQAATVQPERPRTHGLRILHWDRERIESPNKVVSVCPICAKVMLSAYL